MQMRHGADRRMGETQRHSRGNCKLKAQPACHTWHRCAGSGMHVRSLSSPLLSPAGGSRRRCRRCLHLSITCLPLSDARACGNVVWICGSALHCVRCSQTGVTAARDWTGHFHAQDASSKQTTRVKIKLMLNGASSLLFAFYALFRFLAPSVLAGCSRH